MQTILHIGMPKTGSTVLQDRLRGSPEALRAQGLLYPDNPPGCPFNNHRLLLFGFTPHADLPRHIHKVKAYQPDTLAADYRAFCGHLAAQVAARRPERLILSSESLFRSLGPKERGIFAEALAPYGPVSVAVYLRRPSAYYLSALQQQLRGSHTVAPPRARALLPVLDDYAAAFGKQALRPRIYDRSQLAEGDITADFLAAHLPGSGLAAGDLVPARRSNETMSAESMEIMRSYRAVFHGAQDNQTSRDSGRLATLLVRLDAEVGAPRPKLRPEIAEAIDYARPDPLALRDRWGLVFPGLDYDRLARGARGARVADALDRLRRLWRPWRLEEVVPIDRDLQQAILAGLARRRWGRPAPRAAWIAGLRRGEAL